MATDTGEVWEGNTKRRQERLTFELLGEEHLDQQPEEEQHHDALDHPLAAEEQHRLPQRLPRVLLVVVRHGEQPSPAAAQSFPRQQIQ